MIIWYCCFPALHHCCDDCIFFRNKTLCYPAAANFDPGIFCNFFTVILRQFFKYDIKINAGEEEQ